MGVLNGIFPVQELGSFEERAPTGTSPAELQFFIAIYSVKNV
jgi:hypothetical protein